MKHLEISISEKLAQLQKLEAEVSLLRRQLEGRGNFELWHESRMNAASAWNEKYDRFDDDRSLPYGREERKDDYCDVCQCKIIKWRGCGCD